MSIHLFTICGRAGSKGVKGKNSRLFLDIPLVYYTLATIELYRQRHSDELVRLALNTDSDALIELVDRSGVSYEKVMRPDTLATDSASKVDVIRYTHEQISSRFPDAVDYVVDLDITAPLRTIDDLEALMAKRKSSKADSVFTVVRSRRNPFFNMVKKNDDGFYGRVINSNFNTRQQAPLIYDMNASMYAYLPSFLKKGKQIFDCTCDVVEMKDTAVLDLDNPEDFEMMQVIAEYLFSADEKFAEVRKKSARSR